ncbi:MAG: hypothetical protein WC686_02145 [Candidatus Shapirobacteria bacterium]|jgi:hypothetical protein
MKLSNSLAVLFFVIVTIISLGWFVVFLPPSRFQSLVDQASQFVNSTVVKTFPSDLVITVKNGNVTTNQTSPFCLILDQNTKSGIVFDDRANIPVQNYRLEYRDICSPFALVGNDYFAYPDKDESIRIQKFSPEMNLEINRSQIEAWSAQVTPWLKSFSNTAYYAFPISFMVASFVFFLLNNFWYAFVTKAVGKWFGNNVDFPDAYAASLLIYSALIFINIVIISYLLNYILKLRVNLSFPFFNTIAISYFANILLKNVKPSSISQEPAVPISS